jgi:ferritin-like metal-binding protein YciE
MAETEKDVKRAAELKLWLEGRISELQEELERLKETLGYVDSTLKAVTYRPASELLAEAKDAVETRELKQVKGGRTLAVATITSDSVTIEVSEGVALKQSTSPFKSYLLGKVLGEMKATDQALVSSGKMAKGSELRFDVVESGGLISKVIVENYGDRARLNDVISKTTWTFSKMLG